MKRKQIQFILLLTVGLVLAGCTLNATDQTDARKIRNEKFGFEITIPSGWVIEMKNEKKSKQLMLDLRFTSYLT